MKCKTIIFLLIFIVGVIQAETLVLDLETAKEIALQNNPTIKIAEKGVNRAKSQIVEARSGMFPAINAFSSLDHAWDLQKNVIPNFLKPSLAPTNLEIGNALLALGDQFDNQELRDRGMGMIQSVEMMPDYLEMAFGLENTLVYGVQLQQPLFTGGAIYNGYKISKLGLEIAEKQLEAVTQSLLDNVTRTYYFALFAKSAMEVSSEALVSAEENLALVQKFFDSGKASKLDLLRAEVEVANLKPSVISAENNLEMAFSRLNITLGFESNKDIVLSDKLEYKECDLQKTALEELVRIAKLNRPEMAILENQKKIANRQLAISKGSFLPTVALGTTYQYLGMRNDLEYTGDDFNKSFNTSISLSIPLFEGFRKSSKIQQAKILTGEMNDQLNSAGDGIQMEVESAYFLMKEAEKKVETQGKTIEQAQEALRLANLMYKEGAATQLDVLNSNLALKSAKMNYQQSLLEFNNAISQLKKAINKQ
ncbi:MAG: TolC family protein [Candidatus Marinimicrobia bacterium]|nr:TolC family protein [Candidatus Neomarinimicrobiota bacterium]